MTGDLRQKLEPKPWSFKITRNWDHWSEDLLCHQVLMQIMQNEYIYVSFQLCRGGHLFLFRFVCCSSVLKRSKVCSRLVSVFQKRVRNGSWLSYAASLLWRWALKTPLSDDCLVFISVCCRYVSDAVTGVIIVSILFFFPSQKPSLKWWFDPKGKSNYRFLTRLIHFSSVRH